jgi:hypothetical protein
MKEAILGEPIVEVDILVEWSHPVIGDDEHIIILAELI